MQRIPYPDESRLPETVRRMIANTPLNVVRIGAHASPLLFEAQGRLGWAIANPEVLDPQLREIVILRVAYLSRSEYELNHHVPLGRSAGLSEKELGAIAARDYASLSPLFAAAARFTDEVVEQLSPSDATLAALRRLAPDQVVINLVLTIGCYMSIARLAAVTGIERDLDALGHLATGLDDASR